MRLQLKPIQDWDSPPEPSNFCCCQQWLHQVWSSPQSFQPSWNRTRLLLLSDNPTHPFSWDHTDLREVWREDKIKGGCLPCSDQNRVNEVFVAPHIIEDLWDMPYNKKKSKRMSTPIVFPHRLKPDKPDAEELLGENTPLKQHFHPYSIMHYLNWINAVSTAIIRHPCSFVSCLSLVHR